MGHVQAVGDLNADIEKLRNVNRLSADAVLQGLSFEQFHGHEGTAFDIADIVNGADVGMVESGGCAGFAAEAIDGLRIVGNALGNEFQGDVAAEARVLRFVNYAHPTAAEFLDHSVVRNS